MVGANLQELYSLLRSHNALVVHFSGTPKGVGVETRFPDDLINSIANGNRFSLSSSTVMPGDYFLDDRQRNRNATGTIGIILSFNSESSLMAVSAKDAGTNIARQDRAVELVECEASISDRIGYNEWNVCQYSVIGIFVVEPIQFFGKIPMPGYADLTDDQKIMFGASETTDGAEACTIDELREIFPEQRIFTFSGNNIVECLPNGTQSVVQHQQLYQ